MIKKFLINNSIFLIILLAFSLRFYRLGDYPALNADEAAIGYNAYSLLETGKDEHGNSWPIHFQSFNDYKPGLYVYLVMPFVKFLGLNEWAVRIPNAALGVATVYLVYLLVKELFKNLKTKDYNLKLAITASLFLAISPWHIHFSRGGWEVNTSTFFITLGVWFFLKGLRNSKLLLLSSLSFVFSLYTYHAARLVTPLMIFGLLGVYYENVKDNFKKYLLSGVLAFLLLLPLGIDMLKPAISSRASGVGLIADKGPLNRINEQRGEHENYNSLLTKVTHNKLVDYSLAFLSNWSSHYHGLFLFLSGDDIQRNKVPETGQMYMLDALFVIVGLLWMAKNWNREIRIIIHWLLIAPFAAALTFQSPHALRAENMVIPLIIISAIGFNLLLSQIDKIQKNKFLHASCFILLISLTSLQFARYVHIYYTHMSKEYPFSSQYGVKEAVKYIKENEINYKNVLVTTKYDQPYILFLFYEKYDPAKFQGEHELSPRDQFGFSTVPTFGKYVFKNIDLGSDKIDYPESLILGNSEEVPSGENIISTIKGSNGFEYFRVTKN